MSLILESLSIMRRNKTVASDINFSSSRKITRITGKNGTGKTTLLLTIAGLLPIGSGKIFLGKSWSARHRRYLCGVFSDNISPPPYLSVAEALRFCKNSNTDKIPGFEDHFRQNISGTTYIDNLSEGNTRKVGIACAIRCENGVLLLDEPYNAIDSESKKVLTDFLNTYHGKIIYVDHNPQTRMTSEAHLEL